METVFNIHEIAKEIKCLFVKKDKGALLAKLTLDLDPIDSMQMWRYSIFLKINNVNEHITSAPSFQIVLAENLK